MSNTKQLITFDFLFIMSLQDHSENLPSLADAVDNDNVYIKDNNSSSSSDDDNYYYNNNDNHSNNKSNDYDDNDDTRALINRRY